MRSRSVRLHHLRTICVLCVVQLAVLATTAFAALPPPRLDATTTEPRAFGYRIGDLVERSVTVRAGSGTVLDDASVPRAGARGSALELRDVLQRNSAESGGRRYELMLRYQVFQSPRETRILEMPAFTLRFTGAPRAQEIRIEAWPVTVSPLVPVDAPSRRGLGELRPDATAPLIDMTPGRLRLMTYGGLSLLLVGYLLHVYIGLPWWTRLHRPFASAWRELRGLQPASSDAQRRRAYRTIHDALNRTWGEVLFERDIDPFLAGRPRFEPLRADLVMFFSRSRLEHFSGTAQPDPEPAWLVEFCRRCRDAERGAA